MTKQTTLIASTMVDTDQKLKLSSLFCLFQDIATLDAETIGYKKAITTDIGKLWVFTRVYVEIYSYPKYLTESNLTTYPGARKVFAFPRHLKVDSLSKEKQIRLSSLWALIDASSRQLILHPEVPEVEGVHEEDELPLPGKVVAKPCSYRYQRTIRHSDLDFNGHLNNTRYLELLVDAYPTSFYKQKEIASLLLNFESEVHEGETIEVYASEDASYIAGKVAEHTVFEANLTYRNL